jgi:hypothetical protein
LNQFFQTFCFSTMMFLWFGCFRKRYVYRELAMNKLKEGNVNAASELFQVSSIFKFLLMLITPRILSWKCYCMPSKLCES